CAQAKSEARKPAHANASTNAIFVGRITGLTSFVVLFPSSRGNRLPLAHEQTLRESGVQTM
ncbi:hypothetical protein, partial [Burkholderia pseudomallei]